MALSVPYAAPCSHYSDGRGDCLKDVASLPLILHVPFLRALGTVGQMLLVCCAIPCMNEILYYIHGFGVPKTLLSPLLVI